MKKILGIFLAVMLLVLLVPTVALAAGPNAAHNVNFATSGLPAGASITISYDGTNNGGNSQTGSTTFTSPGPSSSIGTQPSTLFSYSGFPASVTVGAQTYNLSSTSPASPFTTGAAGGVTNVTATYNLVVPADTTPPVISYTITGTLGNNGWYVSSVDVAFSAVDDESAITSTNPVGNPYTYSLTTDTTGTTVTYSATSAGGTSTDSVTIKIDKTAPTISGSVNPAAAGTGWYNIATGAPTVSFTATDGTSGIASSSGPTTLGAGAGQSVTGTATDNAGNTASATVSGINVDLTAPTISASATKADSSAYTAGSWTNQDVTVHYSASDTGGSGIASVTPDQAFSVTTATTSGTATDVAGNSASISFGPINIDKIPPTVTITTSSPYLLNQSGATASWTATDTGGSGLATPASGTIPVDTSSVGTGETVTAPAGTAMDNAGNSSATVSASYSVIYAFKGLLDPYSPTKVNKAGSSIPLKWQYTDAAGNVVVSSSAAPSVAITGVSPVNDSGKSGLQYDALTNTWQLNWQTKGLSAGNYQVTITSLLGQTSPVFTVQLR